MAAAGAAGRDIGADIAGAAGLGAGNGAGFAGAAATGAAGFGAAAFGLLAGLARFAVVLRAAAFLAGFFALTDLPRLAALFFAVLVFVRFFAAAFTDFFAVFFDFFDFLAFFDLLAFAITSSCCANTLYHIGNAEVQVKLAVCASSNTRPQRAARAAADRNDRSRSDRMEQDAARIELVPIIVAARPHGDFKSKTTLES